MAPITPEKLEEARSAIGNLPYLARESRPDLKDLIEINRVPSVGRRFSEDTLTVEPIDSSR
eukprot:3135180-Prorocentrum_lima.AAC.1